YARPHRRGNADCAHLGAPGPVDRSRRSRLDGKEEARGLFLMSAGSSLASTVRFDESPDIGAALDEHNRRSFLRFLTCGSVDDGKSTLIGRLLYDTKLIFEDQFAALERDSRRHGTS